MSINYNNTLQTNNSLLEEVILKLNQMPDAGGGGSGEAAEWSENEDAMVTGTLSVYSNDRVTSIDNYAFYFRTNLSNVNFPACTSIGKYAFHRCSSLTSIYFPACTSIDSCAFQYCSNLTSIHFPVCTSISQSAFAYCSSLTDVNFPVCTSIGRYVFYGCTGLTNINFPVCTNIGNGAIYNCINLTSVNFPVCTNIDGYAFWSCNSLTSANFPICTSIGGNAFQYCSNLTSVEFGSSITNTTRQAFIYSAAFTNCSKLTTLKLHWLSVATLLNANAFTSTPMSISTLTGTWGSIYVPASLVAAYKSATNWAVYASRITALDGHSGGIED